MQVTVNDQTVETSATATVEDVLMQIGAKADRVAVTVNGEMVPAARRGKTPLNENDCIDVLTFVGGG